MSSEMNIPQRDTGNEPNSEIVAGRFVPIVDLTHDDEDANFHMYHIPLQRPASAHVSSDPSACVTFSQA